MDHSRHAPPHQSRSFLSSWKLKRRKHDDATPAERGIQTSYPINKTVQTPSTVPATPNAIPKSRAKWRSLFNFTTKRHASIAILSCLFTVLVGAVTPVQSYLLGRVFGIMAEYVAGTVTEAKFKKDVQTYNIVFVGLGTASWIFTSAFFFCWVVFGELQSRGARQRLFKALLARKMEWYDQRKDGMGAMTTKLQSFVIDLQEATAQPLGMVIRDLTIALASLGLALQQQWKLTLVIISTLPATALIVPFVSRKVQPAIDKQIEALGDAAKHLTNSFIAN